MSEEQSTAEQFEQRLETAKHVNQTLAQCLKDARPADDDLVQETIGLHYAWMKEITIHGGKAIYKLLAKTMRSDERYSRIYDNYYTEGLTEYMAEAIDVYADQLAEEEHGTDAAHNNI
jgi:hypothetical protein